MAHSAHSPPRDVNVLQKNMPSSPELQSLSSSSHNSNSNSNCNSNGIVHDLQQHQQQQQLPHQLAHSSQHIAAHALQQKQSHQPRSPGNSLFTASFHRTESASSEQWPRSDHDVAKWKKEAKGTESLKLSKTELVWLHGADGGAGAGVGGCCGGGGYGGRLRRNNVQDVRRATKPMDEGADSVTVTEQRRHQQLQPHQQHLAAGQAPMKPSVVDARQTAMAS